MAHSPQNSNSSLSVSSSLLLAAEPHESPTALRRISADAFEELCELTSSHHVIVRTMEAIHNIMVRAGDQVREQWAATALHQENARIENAISFLHTICGELELAGCDVTVIKSLDHWPDLSSDLDLYTSADPRHVIGVMRQRFHAQLAARSWGDRLACKWNFLVPRLPELVEVHVGRLGQTGENVAIGRAMVKRVAVRVIGQRTFRVPAAEDRLMIATMQRMYRHFYFRLCDIIDTAQLLKAELIDYDNLHARAGAAGIWEGVATFLVIVSDYIEQHGGKRLDLPSNVRASSRFGGDKLYFDRGFLRVPIMLDSARLYASEVKTLMLKGEFRSTSRLILLPCLATAAVLGREFTGSDKGIW